VRWDWGVEHLVQQSLDHTSLTQMDPQPASTCLLSSVGGPAWLVECQHRGAEKGERRERGRGSHSLAFERVNLASAK
jgi:hypothetical protein